MDSSYKKPATNSKKVNNFDQEALDEEILLALNFKKCSECFKRH